MVVTEPEPEAPPEVDPPAMPPEAPRRAEPELTVEPEPEVVVAVPTAAALGVTAMPPTGWRRRRHCRLKRPVPWETVALVVVAVAAERPSAPVAAKPKLLAKEPAFDEKVMSTASGRQGSCRKQGSEKVTHGVSLL